MDSDPDSRQPVDGSPHLVHCPELVSNIEQLGVDVCLVQLQGLRPSSQVLDLATQVMSPVAQSIGIHALAVEFSSQVSCLFRQTLSFFVQCILLPLKLRHTDVVCLQ